MTDFIARRTGPDFTILADGFVIGRMVDCERVWVFVSEDSDLADHVNSRIEADFSFSERLAAIRKGHAAYEAECRAISKAEHDAENAWLRHAERFDPEAQADLALHDALFPGGYR